MGLTRNRGPTLRRGLEEGGDLRARWRGSDGSGGGSTVCAKSKEGRGIPHGSAGVHVAEDRLLIERKYTACSAAVLQEDSDTFIILIRTL